MKIEKQKVKAVELVSNKVEFVSYVKSPANNKEFQIIKSQDGIIIEDGCHTDEANEVKKENKFVGYIKNLIKLDKGNKSDRIVKDYDKEDMKNFEVKEEADMGKFTEEILTTLKGIDTRLSKLERGSSSSDDISKKVQVLKEKAEKSEGDEKIELEKQIDLMERLTTAKADVENYEGQVKSIQENIEKEEDKATKAVLIDTLKDKESLLNVHKERVESITEEIKDVVKEDASNGNENAEGEAGASKKKEETEKEDNEKVLDAIKKVADRVESLEGKRNPSNKIEFELEDAQLNKSDDPESDAFWKDVF